jgi:hypothetical protein
VVATIASGFDRTPFGHVGAAALFDDGGLVVYESSLCTLHTFDAEYEPVASFSRCGDGPEELRNGRNLFVSGDTVAVLDSRRRRIARFLRSGEYLGGQAVELPGPGLLSLSEASGFDHGVINATFVTPVAPTGSPPGVVDSFPLVARWDLGRGTTLDVAKLQHPREAYGTGWDGLMGYPQCTSTSGAYMVMLSRWSHQVAVLSLPSMEVTRLVGTTDTWPVSIQPEGAAMASTATYILGIACDERQFLAAQWELDVTNPRGPPVAGWLAHWTYDGDLLQHMELAAADSTVFGVPVALRDSRVLIRNNIGLDFPALIVAEVGAP